MPAKDRKVPERGESHPSSPHRAPHGSTYPLAQGSEPPTRIPSLGFCNWLLSVIIAFGYSEGETQQIAIHDNGNKSRITRIQCCHSIDLRGGDGEDGVDDRVQAVYLGPHLGTGERTVVSGKRGSNMADNDWEPWQCSVVNGRYHLVLRQDWPVARRVQQVHSAQGGGAWPPAGRIVARRKTRNPGVPLSAWADSARTMSGREGCDGRGEAVAWVMRANGALYSDGGETLQKKFGACSGIAVFVWRLRSHATRFRDSAKRR